MSFFLLQVSVDIALYELIKCDQQKNLLCNLCPASQAPAWDAHISSVELRLALPKPGSYILD